MISYFNKVSAFENMKSKYRQSKLSNLFIVLVVFFSIASLLYACFTIGSDKSSYTSQTILKILYINIFFLLIAAYSIALKLRNVFKKRREKGSKLQIRLINIFSVVSAIPSILMIVFAALFFHKGIDSWFNSKNESVLSESLNVATAYLEENRNIAKDDALGVARAIEIAVSSYTFSQLNDDAFLGSVLTDLMDDLFDMKNIYGGILAEYQKKTIARSKKSFSLDFIPINEYVIRSCIDNNIVEIKSNTPNEIILIVSLTIPFRDNMFLLVKKEIDSNIVMHVKKTHEAFSDYQNFKNSRFQLEIAFVIIFVILALLIILISINFAIIFASQFTSPIINLINASEKIKNGNLSTRVKIDNNISQEIKLLSITFNDMVSTIQQQQLEQKNTNEQLDEKINFISGILAGVSSSVIGIDKYFKVTVYNDNAKEKFGDLLIKGAAIFNILPQISDPICKVRKNEQIELQIKFRNKLEQMLFLVKIAKIDGHESLGYIITVDDVTSLMNAQKQAAWADVARRVAHEIKNPLTPIQLAAERIYRKYCKQISQECDTFASLTNSIVQHVGEIKRLVNEFSFFAKMPEPILKKNDILSILKQSVLFMKNANEHVDFKIFVSTVNRQIETQISQKSDVDRYDMLVDEGLINQVFINILKNSITAMNEANISKQFSIYITLKVTNKFIKIIFDDNGPGFPADSIDKLTDPYFTLTSKGSGLGLAIVKKIVQGHSGTISFETGELGGARVILSFPNNSDILNV